MSRGRRKCRVERRGTFVLHVRAPNAHLEELCDLFGEEPRPALAHAEARVVELAAAQRAEPRHDLLATRGEPSFQPLVEDLLRPVRESQQHVARVGCAGSGGGREDARQLVIGEPRHDRRDEHAHRHARASERLDCAQAQLGPRRARLHRALHGVVERRHGDRNRRTLERGERGQQSASRATRCPLVTMAAGLRNSRSTSRQRRVMPSLRSIGWYGSVTPESATTRGSHFFARVRGAAGRARPP